MIRLIVNGRVRQVDVEPEMPLLWVLRDELNIKGPKFGCGIALCGACTVHVNGEPVRSCSFPVSEAAGKRVLTIEGLAQGGRLHALQQAWIDYQVPQCILPGRADPRRRGAAAKEAAAERPGHRRGDDPHLPLRHLCAHPHRDSRGGEEKGVGMATRRDFLKISTAVGGGLAVGFPMASGAQGVAPEINAWVVIQPDEVVIIRYARSEMGQGSMTSAAQLVAEELECDWSKVRVEYADTNQHVKRRRAWGDMAAVGSRTIRQSHQYLRAASAAAREVLVAAAAKGWEVPAVECSAAGG
jgi:isoquinoline 1-oxidoreductase beta subunit